MGHTPISTSPLQDFIRYGRADHDISGLYKLVEKVEFDLERDADDLKAMDQLDAFSPAVLRQYERYARWGLKGRVTPSQREDLERVEERLHAARDAVREAFRACVTRARQEASGDPEEVAKLEELLARVGETA